jgi:hypothetical protein
MLERCEIIETLHAQDETGYRCPGEACVHCSDCGTAVCAKHSNVCVLCRTVFCIGCLDLHSHPKIVSVESKRDGRKIA